jgi:hypothetical protein
MSDEGELPSDEEQGVPITMREAVTYALAAYDRMLERPGKHKRENAMKAAILTAAPYIEQEWDRDRIESLRQKTGAKAHLCPEWDFLAIDETCPEFEACLCFKDANLS